MVKDDPIYDPMIQVIRCSTDDPPSISRTGDLECSSARAQRFADVGPSQSRDFTLL